MENNHVLNSLKESVESELRKIIKKDDMTPAELDSATKAVCLLEKIKIEFSDFITNKYQK